MRIYVPCSRPNGWTGISFREPRRIPGVTQAKENSKFIFLIYFCFFISFHWQRRALQLVIKIMFTCLRFWPRIVSCLRGLGTPGSSIAQTTRWVNRDNSSSQTYQTILDIRKYQTILDNIKQYQTILDNIRQYQKIFDNIRQY